MKIRSLLLSITMLMGIAVESFAADSIIFTLVNASTNRDIRELDGNDTINLSSVGTRLNIRADVSLGNHDSVKFFLNQSLVNTEQAEPYSLKGDSNGNYFAWIPVTGQYTLRAVALNNNKNVIVQRTISFRIVDHAASSSTPDSSTANSSSINFNQSRGDLIALHYDHSPDPDDGHSVAADKSVLGKYGLTKIKAVCGTYSKYGQINGADDYQKPAEKVMRAAFGSGFLNAHSNWNSAVYQAADAWRQTINSGGHVWVKEGGTSDFTADVVRRLQNAHGMAASKTKERIHVIQHGPTIGGANEENALFSNLTFVKNNTRYTKIGNGNYANNGTAILVMMQRNATEAQKRAFVVAARASRYSAYWNAAFRYWNPLYDGAADEVDWNNWHYLDFSDTVELLHILRIGTGTVADCADFANVFLK